MFTIGGKIGGKIRVLNKKEGDSPLRHVKKKGGVMKALVVLLIVAFVPLMVSCESLCPRAKSVGKGIGSIGEGMVKGTMEAGKGAGALVGGTVQAVTEVLTGKGGDEALETQKEAFERAGKGVKGIVGESLTGVEKSIQPLGDSVK